MESSKGRALRRSHVKSKSGCLTCRHKHIRCDELHPQCRNCLKRGFICDFSSTFNLAPASNDGTTHTIATIATSATASTSLPASTAADNDDDAAISTLWHEISTLQLPDREYFPPLPGKQPGHPHQHPHAQHRVSPPSSPPLQLSYKQLRSSTEPVENLRMMHHAVQITQSLALNGGHRLALGTCNLPVFIDLARTHVFVKNALLGLATSHLNCIVKLTALEALGSRYRRESCKDLQIELGRFSKENADAVLSASIMLGWQVLDRPTYVKFMQGTSQVLKRMHPFVAESQLTELFSPLTPLPARRQAQLSEDFRTLCPLSFTSNDPHYNPSPASSTIMPPVMTMTPLLNALQTLCAILPSTQATSKTELRTTTLVLQNLLQNFRLLSSNSSGSTASSGSSTAHRPSITNKTHNTPFSNVSAELVSMATQFELFYPVRTWLPMMPVSILGVGRRDPWALLVMAYFHVVVVFVVGQLAANSKSDGFGSSSGLENEPLHSFMDDLAGGGGVGPGVSRDGVSGKGSRGEGCGGALFAGRRTEIIVRIDQELETLKKVANKEAELEAEAEAAWEGSAEEGGAELWSARDSVRELVRIEELMRIPLMYVVDYRSRGFTY